MSLSYIKTCWRITVIVAPPRRERNCFLINIKRKRENSGVVEAIILKISDFSGCHPSLASPRFILSCGLSAKKHLHMCFKECFFTSRWYLITVERWKQMESSKKKAKWNFEVNLKRERGRNGIRNPHLAPLCALFSCSFSFLFSTSQLFPTTAQRKTDAFV